MEYMDYYSTNMKPSRKQVLTVLLKKALEQRKEEMVNDEFVKYLLNIGAKIDTKCISFFKKKKLFQHAKRNRRFWEG